MSVDVIKELRELLGEGVSFSIESVRREGVDSFGEYSVYEQESTIWIGAMPKALGKTPEDALKSLKKSISDWRICQK